MNKSKKVILCFLFIVASLNAHSFWINSNNSSKLKVEIGYGHNFPKAEKIPKERLSIFGPMKIQGQKYSKVLKNKGKNYQYALNDNLKKGSYIVSCIYKPTFWTQDVEGDWHINKQKDETKLKAKRCLKTDRGAKAFVNIQNSNDDFYKTVLGHKLEIIPLDNPNTLKVGIPFKLKVLYKGKPLKTKPVEGYVEGFIKDKAAYYGTTDLKGVTEVMALKKGKWFFKANVKKEFTNKQKCDEESFDATIALDIK